MTMRRRWLPPTRMASSTSICAPIRAPHCRRNPPGSTGPSKASMCSCKTLRKIHPRRCFFAMLSIRRQRGQPRIINGPACCEMVEGLELGIFNAQDLMDRVVEEAADTGRPHAGRFRFQIKDLSDHTRLPEEPPIKPGAMRLQRALEFGDHS